MLAYASSEVGEVSADGVEANEDVGEALPLEPEGVVAASETANYKLELTCTPECTNVKADNQMEEFLSLATIKAPVYEDTTRAPIDVACVLDTSSSMSGPRLSLLRKACRRLVGSLGAKDRVCLIQFSSSVRVVMPFTCMDDIGKRKAKAIIGGLHADGQTALCPGLVEGLKQCIARSLESKNEVCSVLLFTDGEANVGTRDIPGVLQEARVACGLEKDPNEIPPVPLDEIPSKWNNAQCIQWLKNIDLDIPAHVKKFQDNKIDGQILIHDVTEDMLEEVLGMSSLHRGKLWRELTKLRQPGAFGQDDGEVDNKEEGAETAGKSTISVNTFGFGERHNSDLLDRVASEFDGMYFWVKNTEVIAESFASCLGGLMSTVAQNISLSVECMNGATRVEILDLEKDKVSGDSGTGRLVFNVGDIQAEEKRVVLFRCRLPTAEAATAGIAYMTFRLRYENVIASTDQEIVTPLNVERSDRPTSDRVGHVDAEHNRVICAEALERSSKIADTISGSDLSRARQVVYDCIKRIQTSVSAKDEACLDLVTELRAALDGLKDRISYSTWGRKSHTSSMRMMSRQRCSPSSATSMRYSTTSRVISSTRFSARDSDDSDDENKLTPATGRLYSSSLPVPGRTTLQVAKKQPRKSSRKKKKSPSRRKGKSQSTTLSPRQSKTKSTPKTTFISAGSPSFSEPVASAPASNSVGPVPGRFALRDVHISPVRGRLEPVPSLTAVEPTVLLGNDYKSGGSVP